MPENPLMTSWADFKQVGGHVVVTLLCGHAGPRTTIGEVRRDAAGREYLGVSSWRWRVGIVNRSVTTRGNRLSPEDMADVLDLATDPDPGIELRAWCRRCGGWSTVNLAEARSAARSATPIRPARLIMNAQPSR